MQRQVKRKDVKGYGGSGVLRTFSVYVDADDEPVDVWAQLVETQFPDIKFSSLDRHSRGEPAHCTNAQDV
ncbi:uncharacterized protein EAE98_001787 [Botrytis deweyae]|uniref:Uncharacterized protein n=2 Tax=Botrytis TaxID=33196 RepID=A0A4Z1JLH1_9HELO|nr:uncharacterized protein EAE98_001787 [Botrytis deweyae]KAF7937473.1 hypothetical protein EAE98_001787 [Botrytis deweyae]TGO74164.1 hypothetical protein BELL_0303g00030 [Botrytis elliptica]